MNSLRRSKKKNRSRCRSSQGRLQHRGQQDRPLRVPRRVRLLVHEGPDPGDRLAERKALLQGVLEVDHGPPRRRHFGERRREEPRVRLRFAPHWARRAQQVWARARGGRQVVRIVSKVSPLFSFSFSQETFDGRKRDRKKTKSAHVSFRLFSPTKKNLFLPRAAAPTSGTPSSRPRTSLGEFSFLFFFLNLFREQRGTKGI